MTNTLPALPVLPSDGPVNPADHPNGIVWADIEVNYQTGKFYYVDRLIPVDEWNKRYAMNPKEIEALKAECAARAAKPFRFVDPEEFGHYYGDEKWVSPLFMETARQSSQRLNDLLDQLKGDAIPPVWLKRHIRTEVRRLTAELAAQRQANLALRQEVEELRQQARKAPAESTGAHEATPATSP